MTTNTKTVAFVNLKGGVGKTTSAIGTAEALARLGHTVTVRDADPSGAATLWAHKALSAGRSSPPPAPSTWNACWRPSGRSTSPPRCC